MRAVRSIDWSRVVHAWGKATDVPEMWGRFLRGEQETGGETSLWLAVSYERTVYTVTPVLVPLLVQIAKSTHPRRADALLLLGYALGSVGGPLRQRLRLAERLAIQPVRNPFKPGQFLEASPPDPAALRQEDAWVEAMEREIERDLDDWMSALEDSDGPVRDAAAHLLAAVHHDERTDEARALARAAIADVGDPWIREEIAWALEWAGKWLDHGSPDDDDE